MRYFFVVVFIFGWANNALAESPPTSNAVCVRDFASSGQTVDSCKMQPTFFKRAIGIGESHVEVCTKVYADSYCKTSPKEFRYIRTVDGGPICTVHFHQYGIAEYCYSNPENFSWVEGVEE